MIRIFYSKFLEQGTILRTILFSVVILILSGLLAWKAATMLHPEILLLLSGLFILIMIGVGQGSLANGVLAVIIASLTVRFSIPTGTNSQIPMSLVITAGVVLWWMIHGLTVEKTLQLKPRMVSVTVMGFIVACLISYLWGNLFRDSSIQTWSSWPFVQLGELAVMVLLPVLFLIAANQNQDTRWVAWLVGIILIGGSLALGTQLFDIQLFRILQVRPLFPTWFICLAFSMVLFHSRMSLIIRAILLGLAAIWFYSVFVIQFRWLSSWLPALTACILVAALRSKRLVVVLIIILVAYTIFNLTTLQIEISSEWDGSTVTRLDAWAHNWRVTKEHWLFGVGPAGYAAYYMTYFPQDAMATHSTYLDIFSQTGIVGFIFFIGLFVSIGAILWRLWRKTRGEGGFIEAFSVAAFGGYVATLGAMALGDWIVPFVYTQTIAGFDYASYTWVILGAAVALYQSKISPKNIPS